MKRKIFDIIQIGDKSNLISRSFDIFITLTIISNILVMFLQTFDELAVAYSFFKDVEIFTTLVFCIEYILRIWTADYLYPNLSEFKSRLRFLLSYDGVSNAKEATDFTSLIKCADNRLYYGKNHGKNQVISED